MAAPNAPSSPPVDLRQRYSVPEHWADPTMYFDPDRLPPLPPIPDAALARQAFRHRSSPLLQPGEPYDRNLNSYEPLEGIGDRLINYAAYKCLRQQFAGATATILGDVTRRLVTNSTFSYLSSAYGLLDRLEFGYSDNLTRNQKVAADLFEAYVGALDKCETLAPGSTELWSWLGALYTPEVWCDLAPTVRRLEDVIRASTRSNATGTPAT